MEGMFHIGQDVVAIKDHTQLVFKKDDVFSVRGISISDCYCRFEVLDIGKTKDLGQREIPVVMCAICGHKHLSYDRVWWFSSRAFAPLDTLCNIEELTEVLTEPLCEVSH